MHENDRKEIIKWRILHAASIDWKQYSCTAQNNNVINQLWCVACVRISGVLEITRTRHWSMYRTHMYKFAADVYCQSSYKDTPEKKNCIFQSNVCVESSFFFLRNSRASVLVFRNEVAARNVLNSKSQ